MEPHLTSKYAFPSICSIQTEIIEEILNPQRHLIMYCWDYFLLSENLLYRFILFIAEMKVYYKNYERTKKQLLSLIVLFSILELNFLKSLMIIEVRRICWAWIHLWKVLQYLNIRILPYTVRHVKLAMRFFALTYSFFNLDKLLIFSFVSTLLSNAITFMFSHYQQILYPNRVKTRRHVWTIRFCFRYYNKNKNVTYSRPYK